MNKIKSVQIQNLHNNGKLYEVGKGGVFDIKDCSMEYPDAIYSLYTIHNKEGKRIAFIENCPVLVEDDVPENEKPKQLPLITEEKPKFNFKKSLIELGAEKQIASDYMKHRTKKKLSDSKTAFTSFKNQLLLAKSMNHSIDKCLTTIIDSGWQKFKAEWMDNLTTKNTDNNEKPNNLKDW